LSHSEGSAPVEFVLVAVLLLLMTFSVIGVSMNGYAKNIAQDVAIDAARYAALADQGAQPAAERANRTLSLAIGSAFRPQVDVLKILSPGGCSFQATVSMVGLPLGVDSRVFSIKETASAICELQE
jgi:uncharacterized membrane-anchored protein